MTATAERVVEKSRSISRPMKIMLVALVGVAILTVTQIFTGTSDLTSSSTASAGLRLAMPILLAGLGGLYAERAGVVNIGLEGMMIAGTWFAAWGSWIFGPWEGLLIGVIGGAFFGLLHAIATVTFNVDHIISGVAINILGLGGMRFLSSIVYTPGTGGSVVQSPPVQGIGNIDLPFLTGAELFGWQTPDFFGWVAGLDLFYISDIARIAGGFFGDVSWVTLVALAIVPFSAWLLWKTPWGLRLRSCGEDPWAAESLGVPVLRMKYYAVIISGALAGMAGAFLVLVQAGIYREGMSGGRGFIGLGAMIFGNWLPSGVLVGSLVFGFGDSLRFRGPDVVRSFILAVGIGLVLAAIYYWWQKRHRAALIQVVIGVILILTYSAIDTVPNQLLSATPYLITLFVLAAASQRLRMPAADGARYVKGEPR
ncbi:MAG: ABC transporter permease [Acidimicrobiia bacterium]